MWCWWCSSHLLLSLNWLQPGWVMLQQLLESREEPVVRKRLQTAPRFWAHSPGAPQEACPDCSLISCIWEQKTTETPPQPSVLSFAFVLTLLVRKSDQTRRPRSHRLTWILRHCGFVWGQVGFWWAQVGSEGPIWIPGHLRGWGREQPPSMRVEVLWGWKSDPEQGYLGTNLGNYELREPVLKSWNVTLLTKIHIVKLTNFPVVMYGHESWTIKKTWAPKNWCFLTVLKKTLGLRGDQTSRKRTSILNIHWKDCCWS